MADIVDVVVEIPKGSRNKYEMDLATGRIKLDRMLFSSVHYPGDYGFIEETLGADGDPMDAIVIVEEATFPGCGISARPVGVFRMSDEKGEDEKVLMVPVSDPHWSWVHHLEEVPESLRDEIAHFFTIYKDLEKGKRTKIHGWEGADTAWILIEEARKRLQEHPR
jgi:inorganic pyrophosphatase